MERFQDTYFPDHVHPVRVRVGHSNPNPRDRGWGWGAVTGLLPNETF